jgi:hypothetical protein
MSHPAGWFHQIFSPTLFDHVGASSQKYLGRSRRRRSRQSSREFHRPRSLRPVTKTSSSILSSKSASPDSSLSITIPNPAVSSLVTKCPRSLHIHPDVRVSPHGTLLARNGSPGMLLRRTANCRSSNTSSREVPNSSLLPFVNHSSATEQAATSMYKMVTGIHPFTLWKMSKQHGSSLTMVRFWTGKTPRAFR